MVSLCIEPSACTGLRQQSIARRDEKDSVVFSAFVNYNIMLCIEFSSLRLKCDMGEVLYCSVSRKGSQACWKRA